MKTFKFTRYFTKGNLKDMVHTDTLTMESRTRMRDWVVGVNKAWEEGRVDYFVFDYEETVRSNLGYVPFIPR